MNKEQAAKTLARGLGNSGKRKVITEEVHKGHLINNCSAFYQVAAPIYGEYNVKDHSSDQFSKVIIDNLISDYHYLEDANYFFLTNVPMIQLEKRHYDHNKKVPFVATPYALLGEKEIIQCKESFYKDVPDDILAAMNTFGIFNYIEIYKSYIKGSLTHDAPNKFNEFVFSLPYEGQNIESNKFLLTHRVEKAYLHDILTNEYAKGKYFQEYFNSLQNYQQRDIAKCLARVQNRNFSNDSFLWSKGFKEINLDYMEFYKNDSQRFIDYFKRRNPPNKRIILNCIMDCNYTNKQVAEWLEENEVDLLREVSMDG